MLFVMVLVSVLPALGIILHYGLAARESAFGQAAAETERMVHGLAVIQQRTTEATRQILHTLSIMPEVRMMNKDAVSRLLRQIIAGNPLYTNMALTDARGQVVAFARPFQSPDLSDRKHFREAFRYRRFAAGEFIRSRSTQSPAFAFACPVIGTRGDTVGVLTAALDLERFSEFFSAEKMPEDAFLGITDHKGLRLYRTVTSSTFPLGSPVSPSVWDAAQEAGDVGVVMKSGSDGKKRVVAFHKLRLAPEEPPYMTFFVGLPEEVVGADAARSMWTSVALLASAGVLALLGAFVAETLILKPKVQALVQAAERFRVGDYERGTGVDHGSGELGLVADALDRMATETRRALESLRAARDAAEDASRTKSEFLANMSHEIRTPLNGVLGMLHLLGTTAPSAEQAGYIETAVRSTNRLTRLLSDILDLARIESRKLVIREDVFAVADLVQGIEDIFAVQARDRGLRLAVRVDPAISPHLLGDEARLRQILFNLVGNAIKFTQEGSVEVGFDLVPATGEAPARVRFTVMDTGVGIPPERLSEIFEPFTQVENAHVRIHQGAGLGLAIVRRLVDLMGGELAIDSVQGEGTTVRVSLALEAADSPRGGENTPEASRRSAGLRVLLAEDDDVNRMAMQGLLGKLGCHVTSVGNGQEAVDRLRSEGADLVFMDVQMPVMDGLQATRAIRDELGSAVPIVAMTAYAMLGDRERFLEGGMSDYVSKPVGLEELGRVLEKWARG
jgi:signal transduction histidine kinase